MAAGGCIALRAGPISDLEAIVVRKLRDGEILVVGVIGDCVAIDSFLSPADGVGEMVLQWSPILLYLLTFHLNYNPTAKSNTIHNPLTPSFLYLHSSWFYFYGKLDKLLWLFYYRRLVVWWNSRILINFLLPRAGLLRDKYQWSGMRVWVTFRSGKFPHSWSSAGTSLGSSGRWSRGCCSACPWSHGAWSRVFHVPRGSVLFVLLRRGLALRVWNLGGATQIRGVWVEGGFTWVVAPLFHCLRSSRRSCA